MCTQVSHRWDGKRNLLSAERPEDSWLGPRGRLGRVRFGCFRTGTVPRADRGQVRGALLPHRVTNSPFVLPSLGISPPDLYIPLLLVAAQQFNLPGSIPITMQSPSEMLSANAWSHRAETWRWRKPPAAVWLQLRVLCPFCFLGPPRLLLFS